MIDFLKRVFEIVGCLDGDLCRFHVLLTLDDLPVVVAAGRILTTDMC